MSSIPTYPSPLTGYADAAPLPNERDEDGKSYKNPPREGRSEAYDRFVEPLDNGRRGGFDVHIYYYQNNKDQTEYAHQLWERIRREFPELRIYTLWDRPPRSPPRRHVRSEPLHPRAVRRLRALAGDMAGSPLGAGPPEHGHDGRGARRGPRRDGGGEAQSYRAGHLDGRAHPAGHGHLRQCHFEGAAESTATVKGQVGVLIPWLFQN
ncbi:hypothetical protein PG989_007141 [Apiospora arundinis]